MNPITLSHPTYNGPSGATAAATYSFFTKNYQPPVQERSVDYDIVHNQNGIFKWIYDNGPGFHRWPAFAITCQDAFEPYLGVDAQTQFNRLLEMWNFIGTLGMDAPEGSYNVHWAQDPRESSFLPRFPVDPSAPLEVDVQVMFEEVHSGG